MSTKPYTDYSIFRGILQFIDENGVEYRYESPHLYQSTGDAFEHVGNVFMRKNTRNPPAIMRRARALGYV